MKALIFFLLATLFSTSIFAELNDVKISGSVLGGYNAIRQNHANNSNDGFDYAANIDISFQLNETLQGFLQLQSSPGASNFNYPGPDIAITDLNLTYFCSKTGGSLTLGSFDTPFGRQTGYLSNNADTFANATLFNPLLYSAFAGSMGTLNTIGAMFNISNKKYGGLTVALSNGTSEDSSNADGSLETVISYTTEPINQTVSVGASYMHSNDANSNSGFNADFDAAMLDLHIFHGKWDMKSYIAQLHYEDQNSQTNDRVNSMMVENTYRVNDKHFVSLRLDWWLPLDNNGNRAPVRDSEGVISEGLPNPGFASVQGNVDPFVDQSIARQEISYGYFIDENILMKATFFLEDYAKTTASTSTDSKGLLAYLNVRF